MRENVTTTDEFEPSLEAKAIRAAQVAQILQDGELRAAHNDLWEAAKRTLPPWEGEQ